MESMWTGVAQTLCASSEAGRFLTLETEDIGMAKTPLVSCIMPTYNRRHFAGKAIEYFLRQDYPNKQLVIVDDGTSPSRTSCPSVTNLCTSG